MRIADLKVLIVDDNCLKTFDIKRALEFNSISKIKMVSSQDKVWELLEKGECFDLIVTDMHYPLKAGEIADHNAGYILIDRLKENCISIPVIICSTRNFTSPDVLGTVWYNKLTDMEFEFKALLEKHLVNASKALAMSTERKREIDELLKDTEKKYNSGDAIETKGISLEEFMKKQMEKRRERNMDMKREERMELMNEMESKIEVLLPDENSMEWNSDGDNEKVFARRDGNVFWFSKRPLCRG